ncbi:MAG: acetylornithine deacetylase [Variibacter sp.]|nr:acetylornithine deacetylase [Variibacter sp.]
MAGTCGPADRTQKDDDRVTEVGAATKVLASLVAFDTTSRNSNLPLIEWVEAYLAALGVSGERIPDPGGAKSNLWVTIGPPDTPGYILSGHTDVVPVDGQSWTSDPFRLTARDGRLYGRGTADMKGFVACCLAAVPDMLKRRLRRPIHLALSYDEEVGCLGVRPMIERIKQAPARPLACFVGEPTGMEVVIGHKSKRSYWVTVRGRSCHSSLAPQGVNAVEYAARLIVKIREIADRLRRDGARDPLYDVPFTTGHTGSVEGGIALNVVPDLCRFVFEFRAIAADDPNALGEEVEAYAREVLEPEMRAVAPEAGIAFDARPYQAGLDTDPAAEVVALAKRLAGCNRHGKVAFGTEAGLFQAAGIPSVVIGPGSIDQAHKADEFVAVDELARCCAFIDGLIEHCAA